MKIHIDIDCFFVSAQRTFDSTLLHKPVAVGGRSDTNIFSKTPISYQRYPKQKDDISHFIDDDGKIRGILTTASYEARSYGIKTAMSISEALQLCPHLIIKAPDMPLYKQLSHALHCFLQERLPLVEQASIDEFYSDITGWISDKAVPKFIENLRHEIFENLHLPVSIGAAHTRYIAKLATSEAKPFGCKSIYPEDFDDFIDTLHVRKFPGIGKGMLKKLKDVKISTLGEFRRRRGTIESWGPYAKEIYGRVNGEIDTPINTDKSRKSIGISRTFNPIYQRDEIQRRIMILSRHLLFAIQKHHLIPTRFSLSIKYEHNQQVHTSTTQRKEFSEQAFKELCLTLFKQIDTQRRLHVIHIALNASEFTCNSRQELSLLELTDDEKQKKLTKQAQKVRERYGLNALRWGNEI